jgi:hypothetical protein
MAATCHSLGCHLSLTWLPLITHLHVNACLPLVTQLYAALAPLTSLSTHASPLVASWTPNLVFHPPSTTMVTLYYFITKLHHFIFGPWPIITKLQNLGLHNLGITIPSPLEQAPSSVSFRFMHIVYLHQHFKISKISK